MSVLNCRYFEIYVVSDPIFITLFLLFSLPSNRWRQSPGKENDDSPS